MHVNSVPKKTPIPKAPSHRLLLGSSASWRFSFFGAGGGAFHPMTRPSFDTLPLDSYRFVRHFSGKAKVQIYYTQRWREKRIAATATKKGKGKKQGAMKSFIVLRSGQICSCKALTNETQVRLYANQEVLRH